jgi:hypothetical protein
MTKLLLNTELVPLQTKDGMPIPSGWIVTDDEVTDATLFVEVSPSDIPDDAENLSEAASAAPKAASKAAKK